MEPMDLKEIEAMLDSKSDTLANDVRSAKSRNETYSNKKDFDDMRARGKRAETKIRSKSFSSAASSEKNEREFNNDDEGKNSTAPNHPPQKPKLSKAERRELQEKQRSAKVTRAETPKPITKDRVLSVPKTPKASDQKESTSQVVESVGKKNVLPPVQTQQKLLEIFSHLTDYRKGQQTISTLSFSSSDIHPSVALLGERYVKGEIKGSNARAIALLSACREFIFGYTTPPDKMLSWDLDKKLRPQIAFLIDCRPHCVSMGTSIKFLRKTIAKIPPDMSERDAKKHILEEIDQFISERITIAGESIAENGVQKIRDGDVLLTFGYSSVVKYIFINAKERGKKFRVFIVDSRPDLEGKLMVCSLGRAGIACTYILLPAVSYVMREVTKVFLGAGALMANGTALARVGTAVVAMMAHRYRVPSLFCCETYKFSERVQMDSIEQNELGHPLGISSNRCTTDQEPRVLNLKYDLTPIKYVNLIITELGIIPPTSVPVLLREMSKKDESGEK